MLSESSFIKVTAATTAVTGATSAGMIDNLHLDSLHVISGLLGFISLLMGCLVWFLRDMRYTAKKEFKSLRAEKDSQHAILFAHDEDTSTMLSRIEGERKAALRARGCAYDPERLQNMITEAVAEASQATLVGATNSEPGLVG